MPFENRGAQHPIVAGGVGDRKRLNRAHENAGRAQRGPDGKKSKPPAYVWA
jgi:hypothetical protein